MSGALIAGELDEGEFVLPLILPNYLLKDSRKPLVHAIRHHKWNLSKRAGRDVGWLVAKKDFFDKGYKDFWELGFKHGYQSKPSPIVDPNLNLERCQDFTHYNFTQIKAAEDTMHEIVMRTGYFLSEEIERVRFNNSQVEYWALGFREGYCSFVCPCHGCDNAKRIIMESEPEVVKRIFQNQLARRLKTTDK